MLIKTKAPVEQASGAQGNEIVFFRWKGAQVARNWAQPSNPNSVQQQAVRGYLTNLSRAWGETLDDNQRAAWNAYAATRTFTNILGDTYEASGFNAYVQHNMILSMRGDSLITTPPATAAPSPYTLLESALITGTDLTIQGTHGNTVLTDLKVFVRCQANMGAGVAVDIRKSVSMGTTFAASFDTCPASGDPFTVARSTLRTDVALAELRGFHIAVTNARGQISPWYSCKLEITA